MNKDEHPRIKEMRGGWFQLSMTVLGFIFLYEGLNWKAFVGIFLINIPIMYTLDLTRNFLRDYINLSN